MRAGQLRHRIVLQQLTTTQNEFGEPVQTWTTFATVYAAVEPLRGREFFAAQQITAELSVRIRIRYRSDVKPAWRAVWGAHTYDIQDVIDVDGRHTELQLMCREVVV